MIYPVEDLIRDQKLICARENEKVKEALSKMVDDDFSQLPIVDEFGQLVGLISERSISRNYFHLGDRVQMLDLPVKNCSEKPITLAKESNVLDVLELLKRTSSIIITDEKKPVGIVTYADVIEFFRDYVEGLTMIEDVETTLRQHIDDVFITDTDRQNAIENAFSHRKKEDGPSNISYDRLTLGDSINLITNKRNWSHFEGRFNSKQVFQTYMEKVRDIRNQLVHFKGHLSAEQYDVLHRAGAWLTSNGRSTSSLAQAIDLDDSTLKSNLSAPTTSTVRKQSSSKYEPLKKWLQSLADEHHELDKIIITFADIERTINESLPQSARNHNSWWSNDIDDGTQTQAWLRTGWEVSLVDLTSEEVVFIRRSSAKYAGFWSDLKELLQQERPEIAETIWTGKDNWQRFPSDHPGIYFGWHFIPSGGFSTYLVIDKGNEKLNQVIFDKLLNFYESINANFAQPLNWFSRSNYNKYKFISFKRDESITDSLEDLEKLKYWAAETVLQLLDAFQPYFKEL